jgi:hypothetical protein
MQSVFSPAARRQRLTGVDAEGRGGELKTYWTKPLYDTSSYAFSIVDLPSAGVGKTEAGFFWHGNGLLMQSVLETG